MNISVEGNIDDDTPDRAANSRGERRLIAEAALRRNTMTTFAMAYVRGKRITTGVVDAATHSPDSP